MWRFVEVAGGRGAVELEEGSPVPRERLRLRLAVLRPDVTGNPESAISVERRAKKINSQKLLVRDEKSLDNDEKSKWAVLNQCGSDFNRSKPKHSISLYYAPNDNQPDA